MKRYIDELTKRIDELIKIYEEYLWKHEDSSLIVAFRDNTVVFNLCEGKEIIDEIYMTFEEKERKFYEAICLKTFAILLGNVMVYYDDEYSNGYVVYHNEARKPYLAVQSNDEKIISLLDSVINDQETEIINNHKIVKDYNKKVRKYLPNVGVLNVVDNRINISKEKLRKM